MILYKYARYRIGEIKGEKASVITPELGALSPVPYAEPTYLKEEFHSPYYKPSHRRLQVEMRKFVEQYIKEEALVCEETGQRPSDELFKRMGEVNLLAMRMGPGKHLLGIIHTIDFYKF